VEEVKDDVLGKEAFGPFPGKGDLHGGGYLEPDGSPRPDGSDVAVAHALAEAADGPQDVGMGIGRHQRIAREGQALVDGQVGANAAVEIINRNLMLAGKKAAALLVGGIFLVRSRGIAVEGKPGLRGVGDPQVVVNQVFHHVGAPEIAGQSHIDVHVHDFSRQHTLPSAVPGNNLFYDGHICLI